MRFLDRDGFRGDPECALLQQRGWSMHPSSPIVLRRAKAKAYMLRNITPAIDDGELIVGKPFFRALTGDEESEAHLYHDQVSKAMPLAAGQGAHMAIDYAKLLSIGIDGVLQEIMAYKNALDLTRPADIEKDEFYDACAEALTGVVDCSARYAAYAEKLSQSNTARRNELTEIARICRAVPKGPARTFHEALQSMHFVTFSMKNPTFQTGRPDRLLIDHYRREIGNGTLTKEFAQELIDCFCMQFNERAGKGTSLGLMVGGRDASGRDVTNELTYMFIESIDHTRLSYPSIGLCYSTDTPDDILRRSCEILASGCTHPALFNDDVIVRGLVRYGLPQNEACEYIHSSCVEITPIASSGVWVASPYHNVLQYLLDIIGVPQNGAGHTPSYASFAEIMAAYRTKLAIRIKEDVIAMNRLQAERHHAEGEDIIAACFTNDCLKRGKSIDKGGARYNWIMPSFVGLANLADSLMVIKRLVFEEKKITLDDLADALRHNFNEREYLRLEIMNRIPHYGNDNEEVDAIVKELTCLFVDETAKYTTFRGGAFIPSLFCWVKHEQLGKTTPASPDGRRAGEALGDGSGPAQGREMEGPTASIMSSTKWDHTPFIGGIAVNMKFGRKKFNGGTLTKMLDAVKTFMDRGGFEMQINVVDRDTLIAARKTPGKYKDLIVRIGGYSDYFTSLTPAMQEEVIARTEHAL